MCFSPLHVLSLVLESSFLCCSMGIGPQELISYNQRSGTSCTLGTGPSEMCRTEFIREQPLEKEAIKKECPTKILVIH